MTAGRWETPLGNVDIASDLAEKIVEGSPYLKSDTLAHSEEHSIEVLLPFLQFVNRKITIVPIVIARAGGGIYKKIAQDIVKAIRSLEKGDDVSIIASSDMTHYESHESAQKKDRYAIEAIIGLDTDSLLERVEDWNITMCGVAPVCILLEVAKSLGAREAALVKYQTSGEAAGDYRSVVGYAGMRIS